LTRGVPPRSESIGLYVFFSLGWLPIRFLNFSLPFAEPRFGYRAYERASFAARGCPILINFFPSDRVFPSLREDIPNVVPAAILSSKIAFLDGSDCFLATTQHATWFCSVPSYAHLRCFTTEAPQDSPQPLCCLGAVREAASLPVF